MLSKILRIVLPVFGALAFTLLILGICTAAFSAPQNNGELLPALPPSFLNASGLVAASGRLCTTVTGSSTPLATYSNPALTSALPNPIVLDSTGRPTSNGSTRASIYIQAASYRITLYAAGTGNTCNGTAVGAQIWQQDGVYNLSQLQTLDFNPKVIDNIVHCAQYSGATAGAKIAACIADLPSTGGTADARGLEGAQTISSNMFSGVSKTGRLLLGAGTYTLSVRNDIPSKWEIVGSGRDTTTIQISGNGVTAFKGVTDTEKIVIRDMSIVGTGGSHTAPCVHFDDSFNSLIDNVDIRLCDKGVYYENGSGGANSSFGGVIRDSRIISANTVNIDSLESSYLTFSHVTFGGGPSARGMRLINTNSVSIFGGDCEGQTLTCIDIDNNAAIISGNLLVANVHFEGNTSSAGDIRIGNTNAVSGVSIIGNTFSAGAGATYPINIVRGNSVFMAGNAVVSGYTTNSAPLLGTVTNICSIANRWSAVGNMDAATSYCTAAKTYVDGLYNVTSGNPFYTVSGNDTRINNNNAAGVIAFRDAAGSSTLMQISNGGTVTMNNDMTIANYIHSTGVTFANLGAPSNGTFLFCTDCTVTGAGDNTCTSGSDGALAVRIAGAWRCFKAQN